MLGGLTGIIDFNKDFLHQSQITEMMTLLGNRNVAREYYKVQPWFYAAQIRLNKKNYPPFYNNEHFFVISDSFIVNKKELCGQLRLPNGISDNELLSRCYDKWKTKCINHLEGLFAFAIWDKKKEELFCARDPLGKRPFYYAYNKGIFRFASELKAIYQDIKRPVQYEQTYFINYLENIRSDEKITFIKSIFKLPPASFLKVNRNEIIIEKYWRPDNKKKVKYKNPNDYIELIEEETAKVLKGYWQDSNRISFWIKGDRKSAFLAAMYSKVFPDKELIGINYKIPQKYKKQLIDNSSNLQTLKKQFKFQLIHVTEEQFKVPLLSDLFKKFWQNDGPFANPTGSDHNVLYPVVSELGLHQVSMDKFFNPFNWSGEEYKKDLFFSLKFIPLLKRIYATSNKSNIIRKLLYDLLPLNLGFWASKRKAPLLVRETLISNQQLFRKHRVEGRFSNLYLQNDLLSFLRRFCLDKLKPATVIERRFGITPISPFNDRRLIDLALELPIRQFAGIDNCPPLFDRLLLKHNISNNIIYAKNRIPWPVDSTIRRNIVLPFLIANVPTKIEHPLFLKLIDERKVNLLLTQISTKKVTLPQYLTFMRLFLLHHFLHWSTDNYNIS